MKYVIDSNILIDFPQVVEEKENEKIVLTSVLKELDGLKKSLNSELAFNARRAAVYISKNLSNLKFIEPYFDNKYYGDKTVDEQLMLAAQYNSAILLTNDVYLKVQCILYNVKTEGYSIKDNYSGIYYWQPELDENLFNQELSDCYEGRVPAHINLKENQYLIVQDSNFETLAIFKNKNNSLVTVKQKLIKNQWVDTLVPRNSEQICLVDALSDRNNTIICAGGNQGRGKSYILNNFALQELEKEKIQKIVYVPNNSYTENSMELGFLPG